MKLKIFGPTNNGDWIVHAAGCKDCAKHRNEQVLTADLSSKEEVAKYIYADQMRENESPISTYVEVFNFAPCVKF